ncbi:hypothetical protein HID58_053754 [Brassica napus]|uniref:DC1 domain-containing protein n=1 Tax=Brassica napus TaxID=3708 RepID=A0ABQ8AH36_BRANA|nr:hypothetical protein HID58_053754 [Brassica napus]
MNMYGCLQCNFFVHRNCIYLPKVIKLTSHRHRLFQTFQVLDFKNCRICDKPILRRQSSPLVEVDDKTSRHFSHQHDLMALCVNNEVDDGRVCQACILLIDFASFLGCKECDFALHDSCVSLPRKMENTRSTAIR